MSSEAQLRLVPTPVFLATAIVMGLQGRGPVVDRQQVAFDAFSVARQFTRISRGSCSACGGASACTLCGTLVP
jgi:hypothetical protein